VVTRSTEPTGGDLHRAADAGPVGQATCVGAALRDAGSVTVRTALALAALLTLAACGDDDEPEAAPSTTHAPAPERSDVEADAAAAVDEHGLPGFGIALVSGDDVQVAVAGTRSHDEAVSLGPDAPFHLGSDTKAMTAVLLATFVEEGRLDLDATLAELFPDAPADPATGAATLRDVLGHRAGLTDDVLDLLGLHAATDARVARADAVRAALAATPRTTGEFAYANVNYMLAGAVAEQLGDAPWEELLTTRVFEPLGMSCGFGAPTGPDDPLGHTADGDPVTTDGIADNPAALGPAGTVHCSMADWARFAGAVLDGLQGEDSAVLRAGTAAELFAGDEQYVAGWGHLRLAGQDVYEHDGSNTLWYARAILLPEHDEALLLASNTGEPAAVTAMDELSETFVRR
jgi:CubicO group peptidase (beta-lactamase class C family)